MRIVLWSGGSNLAGPENPLSAGHPSGAITQNAIEASMIGIREITSRPPCGDEICSYAYQWRLLRRSHHAGSLSLRSRNYPARLTGACSILRFAPLGQVGFNA